MPFFDTPKVAPCPDCGKPISTQATSCVHCGRAIQPGEMAATAAKNNKTMVRAAVIITALIVGAMFLIAYSERTGPFRGRDNGVQQGASLQQSTSPPLELLSYRGARGHGYLTVEGQVRNAAGEKLDRIMAVVECYDGAGGFVTSEDALIEYLPLLVGQTSPFKVMVRDNPAIKKFTVGFKEMFGGSIPHTEPQPQPPLSKPTKK